MYMINMYLCIVLNVIHASSWLSRSALTRVPPDPKAKLRSYGPGLAGALFGAGWWFWLDAFCASGIKVPPVQFLPGIVATLAVLMINSVSRNDVAGGGYQSFDEGVECRSKVWLLMAYLVSLGSVIGERSACCLPALESAQADPPRLPLAAAGAVVVLVQKYATNPDATTLWPGVAGLFQTILILGSGLVFWLTKGGEDDSGSYF